MSELLQWMIAIAVMALLGAIIVWDHKKTKREDRARKAEQAKEDDLWWV